MNCHLKLHIDITLHYPSCVGKRPLNGSSSSSGSSDGGHRANTDVMFEISTNCLLVVLLYDLGEPVPER